jgi:hypothetical protein
MEVLYSVESLSRSQLSHDGRLFIAGGCWPTDTGHGMPRLIGRGLGSTLHVTLETHTVRTTKFPLRRTDTVSDPPPDCRDYNRYHVSDR